MRINVAIPEDQVAPPVLDASLEAVTRLNEALIKERKVPLFRDAVSRVRWKPEPPGQEHFDHAGIVLSRGHGDCDDLAPWHCASLRATGEDPGANAVVRRSGPKKWHAVVERSDGSIDDPSRDAGMGQGVSGCRAPSLDTLGAVNDVVGSYIALPRLALRAVGPLGYRPEAWQARADLPWNWSPGNTPTDVAMAALHASPVSSQLVVGGAGDALEGALIGAIQLARESGFVDDDTIVVGEAMAALCGGADYEDVEDVYGPEAAELAYSEVGSLFRKLGKGLKQLGKATIHAVTSKAGRALISMVPGAGPAAAAALDATGPMLRKMADGKPRRHGEVVHADRKLIVPTAGARPRPYCFFPPV